MIATLAFGVGTAAGAACMIVASIGMCQIRRADDCPECGRAIATVAVSGPSEATLSPCGCTVPPAVLEE